MPMKDELGHRMKEYEARETGRTFLPYLPVYARIDGRGFSKFTRGAVKPFDACIHYAMMAATTELVSQTKALVGYFQSDEISLVWETQGPNEEMFFKGKVQKMTSVLAGIATAAFMRHLVKIDWERHSPGWIDRLPHFDARVFQLPNRTEATNMFVWRESDARKNAISMVARAHFSHKALQNKSGREMLEMLAEKGIDFEHAYGAHYRRGTFVRRVVREVELTEEQRMVIPEKNRPEIGTKVMRSSVDALVFPAFNTVANRNEVIFDGAQPLLAEKMPYAGEWHG